VTTDRSDELSAAGDGARHVLDEKHRAREITLNASRRAIRACASAIRAVHRREFHAARELIAEAAAFLAEADAALDGHHDVRYSGSLHDAKKEFAEANLTLAFVSNQPIPGAEELRVETPAYLNGMAEAASELRRRAPRRARAHPRRRHERAGHGADAARHRGRGTDAGRVT
jgi:translin